MSLRPFELDFGTKPFRHHPFTCDVLFYQFPLLNLLCSTSIMMGSGRLILACSINAAPPGVTETQAFHFVSDDRAEYRRQREIQQEKEEERQRNLRRRTDFRAMPLNKNILDGPVSV